MNHPNDRQIERLVSGKLKTHEALVAQKHIFGCPECLRRLIEATYRSELLGLGPTPLAAPGRRKPLRFVHDTADGLIYGSVEKQGRRWVVRHWGEQLDGMKECATLREANEFAIASFQQMFPEHRCTKRCRTEA